MLPYNSKIRTNNADLFQMYFTSENISYNKYKNQMIVEASELRNAINGQNTFVGSMLTISITSNNTGVSEKFEFDEYEAELDIAGNPIGVIAWRFVSINPALNNMTLVIVND